MKKSRRTHSDQALQPASGLVAAAHAELDIAVAMAYGWDDYTPAMPDEEILKRLLALNLARAGVGAVVTADAA